MVYCGKPSGACHACRERRTRCDQRPEGCTQCSNAKRVCPGYRALGDVIFKDVTTKVIRKAKAGEVRSKAASRASSQAPKETPCDDAESVSKPETGMQQSTTLTCRSLLPTVDERATNFFVANYVVGSNGPTRGHLDYLADVYLSQSLDEGLTSSMKAVGLAGFAHTTHSPYLIKNARSQYIKAIQHTNAALRSPVEAKKDATLLTIIILGIFESLTGSDQRSLRDWTSHINGASSVVKLRGYEGIETIAGRRMLVQVTSNLLISCIQRGDPVPDHISNLINSTIEMMQTRESANNVKVGNPAISILHSMLRFANLHSEIVSKTLVDPHTILSRCLELDRVFAAAEKSTGNADWGFETVFTDVESEYIYNGCYHVYYDCIASQSWNSQRMARYMLSEIIRDILKDDSAADSPRFTGPGYAALLQTSRECMCRMQEDILYSIPQNIIPLPEEGESWSNDHLSAERSVWLDFRERPDEERPLARISGALFLIWAVWFVGMNDMATESIRRFTIKSLKLIGDKMGIKQAYILAAAVESQAEIKLVGREGPMLEEL